MTLKGFRTIGVSLVSLIGSVIYGTQLDITPLQHGIVSAFLAASFSLIILLRLVTDTPVGKAFVDKIDKDIGLTPEMKAAIEQTIAPLIGPLLAQMPQGASMTALFDSLQKLHLSVDDVKTLATAASTPPGGVTTSTTLKVGDSSQTETVTQGPPLNSSTSTMGGVESKPIGMIFAPNPDTTAKPAT